MPGVWPAAVIAALSALLLGFWAARQGGSTPRADGGSSVSRIADVGPSDMTDAMTTLAATPEQLAQFRQRDDCSHRLAWVTVMRAPGHAPGRIRLQSGRYLSPAFDLLDTPVRVAIPYPNPYPTGHGVVSVIGATTDAIVAMTPPWHVPAQAGLAARDVTWIPAGSCPAPGPSSPG